MEVQKNNSGDDENKVVLRPDVTGNFLLASVPATVVFIGIVFFQEAFSERYEWLFGKGLWLTIWIPLVVMMSQIRRHPSRFFAFSSDGYYLIVLIAGIVFWGLAVQESLLDAALSLVSSIKSGVLKGLIGFAIWIAQVMLMFEAVRIGISWRYGSNISSKGTVNPDTSDKLLKGVPSVAQLREKLSSLTGRPNES